MPQTNTYKPDCYASHDHLSSQSSVHIHLPIKAKKYYIYLQYYMYKKDIYGSFQNVFIMVFRQYKINYHAQNVNIWIRNVECHDLTFCMQCVMLRKRAVVWKSKQNQCVNELLNVYKLAMTCRMDRNHTDEY